MRRQYSPHVPLVVLLICGVCVWPAGLPGQVASDASSKAELDTPEPLTAERNEAAQDRVHAATLAALGRLHFRRQEYLRALRCYERARRYDAELVDTNREIVPLAFTLSRSAEATRYAVLAAEGTATDPRLLSQLGDYLAARREVKRAEKFYTRAMQFVGESDGARRLILWNKLGRLRFLVGDFTGSAAAFDQLVVLLDALPEGKPKDEEIRKLVAAQAQVFTLIGEAYLQAERWDDAEAMFHRAEDASPASKPARLAFYLARVAVKRPDWTAARRHWEQFWKDPITSSSNAPYEILLALLRHETSNDEAATRKQAIATLEPRLQDRANAPVLANFLAKLYADNAQWDKALAIYQRVASKTPLPKTLAGLVRVALHQDRTEQAIEAIGRLVETQQSLRAVAGELTELIEDEPRRDAFLNKAVSLKESDRLTPAAALAAGRVAIQAERFDTAQTLYEAAMPEKKAEQAEVRMEWATGLLNARQYDRAASVLRQAIRDDALADRVEEAYFFLAGALAMLNRTDDALRSAKRAAALKPDSAEYLSRVAWIHYQAEQDQEAESAYQALLDRWDGDAGDETREVLRKARMALSNLCLRQDRIDESVEWVEQVLDEFPEDLSALNDLGYLWADRKLHLNRALRMTQQAVAGAPENRAYRDSLGWAYHRLNRNEEALRELRRALEEEGTDGVILDHLGDVHWDLRHRKQALDAWRESITAFQRDGEGERGEAVQTKLRQRESAPPARN